MERKLTAPQIIGSLIFPVLTMTAGLASGIMFVIAGLKALPTYSLFAAAVLGGILPIILTFSMKICTSYYFIKRLVFLLCSLGALAVFGSFVGDEKPAAVFCRLVIAASVIVPAFYFAVRYRDIKEWIVVFLSNPMLWFGVWLILLLADIKRNNPFLYYNF